MKNRFISYSNFEIVRIMQIERILHQNSKIAELNVSSNYLFRLLT